MKLTLLSIPLALALVACGSVPSPVEQLATSQGALRAAEEAGADSNPDALLYLKLSREALAKGKEQMEGRKNELADRNLRRAEADAELARGIARKVSAQAEAEEAQALLKKLKPETGK